MAHMKTLPLLDGAKVIVIDEGWLYFLLNVQSKLISNIYNIIHKYENSYIKLIYILFVNRKNAYSGIF